MAKPLLEAVDVLRNAATARPTGFLRPNSKWSRLLRTQPDHRLWETAVLGKSAEHTHEGDLVRETQPVVGAPPQGDLAAVGLDEGGIADQAGAGDVGVGDRHGSVRDKGAF